MRKYERVKAKAIEIYKKSHPTSAEILEMLEELGYAPLPTDRAIRRWCELIPEPVALPEAPRKPQPVARRRISGKIHATLYPPEHPEFILHAQDVSCDIFVRRSPALSDGTRIYSVLDGARMDPATHKEKSFTRFLSWLERHIGRRLDLYTVRDGKMERVEDEPINLFTGIAA